MLSTFHLLPLSEPSSSSSPFRQYGIQPPRSGSSYLQNQDLKLSGLIPEPKPWKSIHTASLLGPGPLGQPFLKEMPCCDVGDEAAEEGCDPSAVHTATLDRSQVRPSAAWTPALAFTGLTPCTRGLVMEHSSSVPESLNNSQQSAPLHAPLQGAGTLHPQTESSYHLSVSIKFYWHMAAPIHLCIMDGCLQATKQSQVTAPGWGTHPEVPGFPLAPQGGV